jgi:hypothetical protein
MDLSQIQEKCITKLSSNKWASYDLYDALTNRFLEKISSRSDLFRRIIIQINAKSPINFRWIGMKKMIHTKTLSDLLWYYSLSENINKIENVNRYFDLLVERKNKKGYGWGLNFPYTSRFINADSEMPNLYNTVNSGIAICHAFEFLSQDNRIKAVEALKGILVFLESEFGFVDEGDRGWYLYYPGQKHPTYNVNALTIYFMSHVKNLNLKEIEIDSDRMTKILNLLIKEQNDDGSWYYARSEKGKWIDGFHTAFVLESLAYTYFSGFDVEGLYISIEKAWSFYINKMITKEGFPRLFVSSGKYPIESQNCAQSIQTIACVCKWLGKNETKLLNKIVHTTLDNLYNENGYFYYKKTMFWTYKTDFSRWSVTPMILALEYVNKLEKK